MNYNEIFEKYLLDDEEIIQGYKPTKKTSKDLLIKPIILFAILFLLPAIICLILSFLIKEDFVIFLTFGIASFALFIIASVIFLVTSSHIVSSNYYCITNKRVIVRVGSRRITYASLNYEEISNLTVYQRKSELKTKPETGAIYFFTKGSAQNVAKLAFTMIEDPYKVYKEIASYIDQAKNNN